MKVIRRKMICKFDGGIKEVRLIGFTADDMFFEIFFIEGLKAIRAFDFILIHY